MYSDVRLFRRRFIPDELNDLREDKILYMDEDLIITSWDTIKPRSDFASGFSAYYRKEGWKISCHLGQDGSLTRWYCDIITETEEQDRLIFEDLLIDVIIYPDGKVRVVDLDEAADALEQGLITPAMLTKALRSTDKLLNYIHKGRFPELTECIKKFLNNV